MGDMRPTPVDPGSGSPFLTKAAGDAAYVTYPVIATSPTYAVDTTGATDSTAGLQAAINATPDGGTLYIPSGLYKLTAALTLPKNISIVGGGVNPVFQNRTSGNGPYLPVSPYLNGTVLYQTTAAVDAITISASAISVNLHDFGIRFANGLASTGHGINASPTQTFNTGHDMGLNEFKWENIPVYGHDGDHYAYRLLNPLNGEIIGARSYGGGGYWVGADGSNDDFGNIVWIQPYSLVFNVGTAGGFVFSSATHDYLSGGQLNLQTFVRPQCNLYGASLTALTQNVWNDYAGAGWPVAHYVIGVDMEAGAATNLFNPSPGTYFVGGYQVTSGGNKALTTLGTGALRQGSGQGGIGIAATAIGNNALNANTTGNSVTAVGDSALKLNTSASDQVAVGSGTLATVTTGHDNTAVGSYAGNLNAVGNSLTAVGSHAAQKATGNNNTAVGSFALNNSTSATDNTSVGASALTSSTGAKNTAVGSSAGINVTSGTDNTLVGYQAGVQAGTGANSVTTASNTTFIGYQSGPPSATQAPFSTGIGYRAAAGGTTTGYATALGANASASAAGSVAIGVDNAATGAASATTNLIVLGTALHTTQIPGLPAFVAGDKYLVVDASGNIHKSALGPAS